MVERILGEQESVTLFHYTDAGGLLGILRNSFVWASDLRFLNDAQEAVYALDLLSSSLREMKNPALNPDHPAHQHAEGFGRTFERYKGLVLSELGLPDLPIFVTCFCESGDLLSQRRGYGTDHGYSIEYRTDALKQAVERIPGTLSKILMPVHYGPEAANLVLSTALEDVTHDTNLGHYGVHAHYMALRLNALLGAVKHPGFSEEREWRIIAAFERGQQESVQFRSSSVAIVPYIEIAFPKDAIVTVRVGPGRHVEIRRQGVERLLRNLGYDAQVLTSDVPLRN